MQKSGWGIGRHATLRGSGRNGLCEFESHLGHIIISGCSQLVRVRVWGRGEVASVA